MTRIRLNTGLGWASVAIGGIGSFSIAMYTGKVSDTGTIRSYVTISLTRYIGNTAKLVFLRTFPTARFTRTT